MYRGESGISTAGAVKKPVPRLNSVIHGIGAGVVVDFPEAEPDEGHLLARRLEGHSGCGDHFKCMERVEKRLVKGFWGSVGIYGLWGEAGALGAR